LQKHPWFGGLDWEKLMAKRLVPPSTTTNKAALDKIQNERKVCHRNQGIYFQHLIGPVLSGFPHGFLCGFPVWVPVWVPASRVLVSSVFSVPDIIPLMCFEQADLEHEMASVPQPSKQELLAAQEVFSKF
jgi:hypothetical protein